jgi:uncharacterized Tic20 family protein
MMIILIVLACITGYTLIGLLMAKLVWWGSDSDRPWVDSYTTRGEKALNATLGGIFWPIAIVFFVLCGLFLLIMMIGEDFFSMIGRAVERFVTGEK